MSTVAETSTRSSRPLVQRGLIAVVLSAVANALLLVVVQALGVAPGFRPLAFPPVVFLTVVGAVGAVAVYWLVARFSDSPNRTFTVVAAVGLVLSFVPDLALLSVDPEATLLGVVALMAMHVVVAGICVAVLTGRTG